MISSLSTAMLEPRSFCFYFGMICSRSFLAPFAIPASAEALLYSEAVRHPPRPFAPWNNMKYLNLRFRVRISWKIICLMNHILRYFWSWFFFMYTASQKKEFTSFHRKQLSPLLYSIDIWPARNSRLTQCERNHYIIRCASVLAWTLDLTTRAQTI